MTEEPDAGARAFDLFGAMIARGVPPDVAREVNAVAEANRPKAVLLSREDLDAAIRNAVASARQGDDVARLLRDFLIGFSSGGAFWLYQDWLVQMKSLFMGDATESIAREMARTAAIRDAFRQDLGPEERRVIDDNWDAVCEIETIFKEEVAAILARSGSDLMPSVVSFELTNSVCYRPLEA